jgi:hypothetical protein
VGAHLPAFGFDGLEERRDEAEVGELGLPLFRLLLPPLPVLLLLLQQLLALRVLDPKLADRQQRLLAAAGAVLGAGVFALDLLLFYPLLRCFVVVR